MNALRHHFLAAPLYGYSKEIIVIGIKDGTC